jgi:HEAT repeat protein
MRTIYTVLILTVCGCLVLGGLEVRADDAPAADVAKLLKSDKEADKVKALDDLGASGEKAAVFVTPIGDLLKDKSAKVRAHAALALGAIGPAAKAAVPDLAGLLKDPDETVRRSVVRALRSIRPGPQVMIPLCAKLLEDPDLSIRTRILNTIAESGVEAVPGLIAALKDDKVAYWALIILRDIGPAAKDAIPAILEKLSDKRPQIRREAVLTLGVFGDAAIPAISQIAKLLSDEHARTAATFVLGELGQIPSDAEVAVRANAKSPDQLLSTASLWALAKVHPEDKELRRETTEKLVARLKDKDAFVRVGAARALAALPPAPEITVPIWENALKDADENTMRHAMDALAALGAPAVPRMIGALKYEKFRVDIVYALGRIGPPAAAATGELTKLIGDKNSRVAHEAIIALGNIGPGAKDAVLALTRALQQPDDRDLNFAAIAFALGKIGPAAASAESTLLKLLASKDDNVRLLSAWALAQIDPATPLVANNTVPVLIAGLALPIPEDRSLSAEALGGFGALAKSAVEALKKAASDENKDVQEAAAKALNTIEQAVAVKASPATPTIPATPSIPATPLVPAEGLPKPGDSVVSVEDRLEIGMKGSPGEIVPKGTKLKILEIRGPWIGVRIEGTEKTGWVRGEQIGRP